MASTSSIYKSSKVAEKVLTNRPKASSSSKSFLNWPGCAKILNDSKRDSQTAFMEVSKFDSKLF